MLEERVNTLETKLREWESLEPIRAAIAKRNEEAAKAKKEADAAAEKDAEEKRKKAEADNRAQAIAAAKAEGREPPKFEEPKYAPPQKD
jgi:hypothetical protein